jgi:hypothetical protein
MFYCIGSLYSTLPSPQTQTNHPQVVVTCALTQYNTAQSHNTVTVRMREERQPKVTDAFTINRATVSLSLFRIITMADI